MAHRSKTIALTLTLAFATLGIQASSTEHDDAPANQLSKVYDASEHMTNPPEEVFEVITELTDVWDVEKNDLKHVHHKLREAQVAAKANDWLLAEELFIEALNTNITNKERYWALLQMAAMYQRAGNAEIRKSEQTDAFMRTFGEREMLHDESTGPIAKLVKAATVYERFIATFNDDDLVPFVNLQLGRLYRTIGTYELANSRFYNVITAALNIRPANIPAYKNVVIEAQHEIAETYFLQGKYKEAGEFYERLKLREITEAMHQEALFKIAYCQYMQGQHGPAEKGFQKFLVEYPSSILAPESYYLLANLYTLQNQPQKAVAAIYSLLSHRQVTNPEDKRIWNYWQKKTANEIANEFYEQRDYMSALQIYQTMFDLDHAPQWRAPTMYQIALCFNHLEAPKQAIEVFDRIANGEFWDAETESDLLAKNQGGDLGKDIQTIQDLAKWHAKQIGWNINASNRIQRLMYLGEEGS